MTLTLDHFAYCNRLNALYPEQKLTVAAVGVGFALCGQPTTQVAVGLWMAMWAMGYARVPWKLYLGVLAIPTLFLAMSLPAWLANWATSDRILLVRDDVLAQWQIWGNYLYLSRRGLETALLTGLRSLACTAALAFVLCTVPFVEQVRVLQRLHFPDFLAELLLLTYRFIFVLLDTADDLRRAQQARCGYSSWRNAFRSSTLLIGQLFVQTLHRYRQFQQSLESRGFNGEFQVQSGKRHRFSRRYAWETAIGSAGLLGLECWTRYR